MTLKNNKSVSIITITYDKELEFLKYNLKSIKKYCSGYKENVIVLDDHENDCTETKKYLDSIGQKYYINTQAKNINKGYIRQQYIKLYSDLYVDADYICHVDTDSIFTDYNTPDMYFKDGIPVLNIQQWSKAPNTFFKRWTYRTVGFVSDYNFMRMMPLIYPRELFYKLRAHIQSKKGSIIDHLNSLKTFSEYNALGAYAYKFNREMFHWIDIDEEEPEWLKYKNNIPFIQCSSRRHNPRQININNPPEEYLKL